MTSPAIAQPDLDALARDVDRLESLRAAKDVQRHYAQYSQFGRWEAMAGLFAEDGVLRWGDETVRGRAAIAAWLTRRGGGRPGLAPGALHTELIDQPLVTLSADGESARGRWNRIAFLGDGQGAASIEGGVQENRYTRTREGWRIAELHYHPQFEGSYANGWTNIGGADLPIVPFHFTVAETGVPIPPPAGKPPRSKATLAELERRITALNDEDAVRNLQHAYGYYVDRRMWDDVVDLFAEGGTAEIGGTQYGVRQAMELMGPAGLSHGMLNDRPLFDTIVQVAPNGREAWARGIELGMIGDAGAGTARWEIAVFRNRFVKQGGIWKLAELHVTPLMRADYDKGWGDGGSIRWAEMPAFLDTPSAPKASGEASGSLAEARRRLARSQAWDGSENVSSAYGFYIDDFQWGPMGDLFAEHGNKQSPFAGYYLGRERISRAATVMWGAPPETRPGISYHWRSQLVVHVSHDGRSANIRTRLFQPRTGKEPSKAGAFYAAGFSGGMYPNDQAVLEDGAWKLWSLTIDEHYFASVDWKQGWSAARDPEPGERPRPSKLVDLYPPDVLLTALGRRMEGFRGGTGDTLVWPAILPMWFHYRNPVSGRVPDRFWPDCVPCELLPESRMTAHGYQMPPTGPEVDGVELRQAGTAG